MASEDQAQQQRLLVEDTSEEDAIDDLLGQVEVGNFQDALATVTRTFPSPFVFSDRQLLHKLFDCIHHIDHYYLRDDEENNNNNNPSKTQQLADVMIAITSRDASLATEKSDHDNKLPLHRACFCAHHCRCCKFELPIALLKALVEAYPQAVEMTTTTSSGDDDDDDDDLPLHIAARLRSEEIILYFLELYPAGASRTNGNGVLPLEEVLWNDSPWLSNDARTVQVLDRLHQAHPAGINTRNDRGGTLLTAASHSIKAEWIIDKNPALCGMADQQGSFPLHSSLSRPAISVETLTKMMDAYPQALHSSNQHGFTPFHRVFHCAIRKDREQVLQLFCDKCPDGLSIPDKTGKLPIHLAVGGYEAIGLETIHQAYPAGLNAVDNDGNTPLHMIKKEANAEWCIDKNPNLCRVTNKLGELPLHVAAKTPLSVPILQKLIQAFPEGPKQPNANGELPLHKVVKARLYSGTAAFHEIINAYPEGASHPDMNGVLPIHHFMQGNCQGTPASVINEVLDRLIEASCSSPGSDGDGTTTSDISSTTSWVRAATDHDGNTILHYADDPVKVAWAVERFPELCKVRNNNGDLPLHKLRQIYSGGQSFGGGTETSPRIGAVQSMLEAFPDALKTSNHKGQLPLHKATACRSKPILQAFLDGYPEAVSQADEDGRLPIHHWMQDSGPMCVVYDTGCLQLLNEAYPKGMMAQDKLGNTPLHLAADAYRVSWALRASPEACQVQNNNGEYPLHVVNFKVVASPKILDRMIDQAPTSLVHADHVKGNTPLHNAILQGASARTIAWLLNKNPAAASHSNKAGKLPLHILCEQKPERYDGEPSNAFQDVLFRIIEAHPMGLGMTDQEGRLPVDCARNSGQSANVVARLAPPSSTTTNS